MPYFCINGNFANLSRYLNGTLIDNLVYSYISSGNRLSGVHDNSNNALGYDDNNGNYTYDANGNMAYDPGKGVNIGYNELNLPQQVQFGANDNIRYTYDAAGRKLIKVVDGTIAANNTRLDYCGNFVYEDNQLKAIFTSEGRIVKDGATYKFEYNMTDHLGNVRAAFIGQSSGVPLVTQRSSYFPFGMVAEQTESYSTGILKNKYLYNGKELQDDEVAGVKLDWYDYGARMYDAELARFHSVDPLAEKYCFQSPYAYAANNPILFIDWFGMEPKIKGPYSGRAYVRNNGTVVVYRVTTGQRVMANTTKQAIYSAGWIGVGLSMGEAVGAVDGRGIAETSAGAAVRFGEDLSNTAADDAVVGLNRGMFAKSAKSLNKFGKVIRASLITTFFSFSFSLILD